MHVQLFKWKWQLFLDLVMDAAPNGVAVAASAAGLIWYLVDSAGRAHRALRMRWRRMCDETSIDEWSNESSHLFLTASNPDMYLTCTEIKLMFLYIFSTNYNYVPFNFFFFLLNQSQHVFNHFHFLNTCIHLIMVYFGTTVVYFYFYSTLFKNTT